MEWYAPRHLTCDSDIITSGTLRCPRLSAPRYNGFTLPLCCFARQRGLRAQRVAALGVPRIPTLTPLQQGGARIASTSCSTMPVRCGCILTCRFSPACRRCSAQHHPCYLPQVHAFPARRNSGSTLDCIASYMAHADAGTRRLGAGHQGARRAPRGRERPAQHLKRSIHGGDQDLPEARPGTRSHDGTALSASRLPSITSGELLTPMAAPSATSSVSAEALCVFLAFGF